MGGVITSALTTSRQAGWRTNPGAGNTQGEAGRQPRARPVLCRRAISFGSNCARPIWTCSSARETYASCSTALPPLPWPRRNWRIDVSIFSHDIYDNIRTRTIVLHQGHILLIPADSFGEGDGTVWRLPGGGLKPHETLAECARREVLEET